MTNIFSRSWKVTKLSFSVISKDKEMLLFPILSGVFSVIFVIAMLFPSVISKMIAESAINQKLALIFVFLTYLGLAFISTFFAVATVFTTKKRFDGKNATFFDSLGFAFSKVHLIFLWSLVSATVGLILKLLEGAAEKAEGVGEVVLTIIRGILGMAWAVVSVFVVPAMVYNNVGPFKALKQSARAVKKTWGESLIRYYGLGLMQFLFLVLGVLVFGAGFYFLSKFGGYVVLTLGILTIVYLFGVFLIFNVANSVYNTALFIYSHTGKVPGDFTSEVVSHAFVSKKKK